MQIYIYICMYVCMYVCMYIYIYLTMVYNGDILELRSLGIISILARRCSPWDHRWDGQMALWSYSCEGTGKYCENTGCERTCIDSKSTRYKRLFCFHFKRISHVHFACFSLLKPMTRSRQTWAQRPAVILE